MYLFDVALHHSSGERVTIDNLAHGRDPSPRNGVAEALDISNPKNFWRARPFAMPNGSVAITPVLPQPTGI
jgi:hypothetical protein